MKANADIRTMSPDFVACQIGLHRFMEAMADKLIEANLIREAGNWNFPLSCLQSELDELMLKAFKDADYISIANYAMMLWNRQNPHGRTDRD